MSSEAGSEWTPVAQQAIGVVGQASETVQIVVTVAITVILLAAISAWYFRGHKVSSSTEVTHAIDTVPVNVLIAVTEESARQVQGLREAVEQLRLTLTGCHECVYFQTFQKEKDDVA